MWQLSCRSLIVPTENVAGGDSVIFFFPEDSQLGERWDQADFVNWCDDRVLSVKLSKTKDLSIDYWKESFQSQPVSRTTKLSNLLTIFLYIYLGVVIDSDVLLAKTATLTSRRINCDCTFLENSVFVVLTKPSCHFSTDLLCREFSPSLSSAGGTT